MNIGTVMKLGKEVAMKVYKGGKTAVEQYWEAQISARDIYANKRRITKIKTIGDFVPVKKIGT